MFGATIGFGSISSIIAAAFIGDVITAGSTTNETTSAANAAGQATQVSTITVDSYSAGATYTWTINGVSNSVVGAGGTTTTVAVLIAAAIAADPYSGGFVRATSNAAIVTLTALGPGTNFSFVVADSDAKLTCVDSTAAAAASAVAFGRVVITTGYSDTGGVVNRKAAIPVSSYFTAQVVTLTVDYAASEEYTASITINGVTYSATVIADTDDATTATNLAAAINAKMPAATVLAAGVSDTVTLTAEVPGTPFSVGTGVLTTDARLTSADTTVTPLTDIDQVILGVTIRDPSVPYSTVDGTSSSYPANWMMDILVYGDICVASTQTILPGEKVYVETAAGASCGLCYNTASATRILSKKLRWARDLTNDSTKAVLRVAA